MTFGVNPKKKEHYGIMMYHRNRLIKAYEKVGCQLKVTKIIILYVLGMLWMDGWMLCCAKYYSTSLLLFCLQASGQRVGIGVIGIIECNFLKPAHNKQDFEYTKEYRYIKTKLSLPYLLLLCVFVFRKLGEKMLNM